MARPGPIRKLVIVPVRGGQARFTVLRRTPLRLAFDPRTHQRSHYLLDERPAEPTRAEGWEVLTGGVR